MKKKRIIWIDVLRLVGILMVLTIHVVGNTINTFGLGGNVSLVYKVLSGISAASISLFVLISGGMFLGKDISYKDMFFKYIIKTFFIKNQFHIMMSTTNWLHHKWIFHL